jgi:hypothetical protein
MVCAADGNDNFPLRGGEKFKTQRKGAKAQRAAKEGKTPNPGNLPSSGATEIYQGLLCVSSLLRAFAPLRWLGLLLFFFFREFFCGKAGGRIKCRFRTYLPDHEQGLCQGKRR